MRSHVRRGERGAFLIIFALSLTVILIVVAMTVDLGQARFSKRDEQQLADLASLSAGREMAGYGATSGGTVVSRPRAACKAAMASIRTNSTEFDPTDTQIDTACNLLPETIIGCTATTLPTNASVTDEPYAVTVRWPIPADEIEDPRFSGAGANDGSNQCQRLRVAVQRVDDTAFAGVIGVGSLTTSASAVIRSSLENNNKIIPAFLILERSRCAVLTNSVGGTSSLGIQILGIPSTDQPGSIHVDSTADHSTGSEKCGGNAENSVAVYGTPLSNGEPSVFLHPAPVSGNEGLLYAVASPATRAAKSFTDGINVAPQPGEVVSRAPIDDEFEDAANPAISTLHNRARVSLDVDVSVDVPGDGWKRLGCGLNELNQTDTDRLNWYVQCEAGYVATAAGISNAATALGQTPAKVVFSHDVAVAGGTTLDFTTTTAGDITEVSVKGKINSDGSLRFGSRIERIYVGGATANNASSFSVGSNGDLRIRATALATKDATDPTKVNTVCPLAPQSGKAELVIFGDDGPIFQSAGGMAICNTTAYLAGDLRNAPFAKRVTLSGGNCSSELPCPSIGNAADAGYFLVTGPGNPANEKFVDWTAPNQTALPPGTPRGLEDLLFWSESSQTSSVKSNANLITQGTFIGPNMHVEFQSPARGEPRNAQFIARSLKLLQGSLYMLPNPNDSTPIPAPGSFVIIR